MALIKEVKVDKIEIVGDYKAVQCREATIISEDGVEISRTFHRHSLVPSTCEQNEDGSFTHTDTDISGEPQETQDICEVVWTNAVRAAFKTFKESDVKWLP